jgi:hypothetical protein
MHAAAIVNGSGRGGACSSQTATGSGAALQASEPATAHGGASGVGGLAPGVDAAQLAREANLFLFAGHDTTSATLAWGVGVRDAGTAPAGADSAGGGAGGVGG